MSDPCNDAYYGCGETQPAITSWWGSTDIIQSKNRTFTLKSGDVSIVINGRTRNYAYHDRYDVQLLNFRYVAYLGELVECYTRKNTFSASISENYQTKDVTFYYADLRTNTFVYKESVQSLNFADSRDYVIHLRTSYNDALVYPFIFEVVPIITTNRIICTDFAEPLHTEIVNGGYAEGVRILMPLFAQGSEPRAGETFTINGRVYDAAQVDWYYPPDHEESDGDQFFWWSDWLKAVGMNDQLDVWEAEKMYGINGGQDTKGVPRTSPDGVITSDFMGSAARDVNGNEFFSAQFNITNGQFKVGKLVIKGADTPIPAKEEADLWFPVAPL